MTIAAMLRRSAELMAITERAACDWCLKFSIAKCCGERKGRLDEQYAETAVGDALGEVLRGW